MNTRGGLGGLLDTIFNVLGVRLQPWMAPVVVVVLALLLLPFIYRNQSTAKARRVMTRACSTSSSVERDKLEAEAKTLVAGNPDGLAAVADMALQRGRRTLARALVDELAAIGIDAGQDFTDHRAAFFYGKHRVFVGVIEHGDDDLVKKRAAPLDDVEMSVCQRVK